MHWTLSDFLGFAATVVLGVVAIAAIVCMFPDLWDEDDAADGTHRPDGGSEDDTVEIPRP